jgi:hypothetical protein
MKISTLLPAIISALRAWDLIWINAMQDDARPADEGFARSGHFSPRMVARLRSSALAATSSELPDMAIAATPGRQADRADLRLLIQATANSLGMMCARYQQANDLEITFV